MAVINHMPRAWLELARRAVRVFPLLLVVWVHHTVCTGAVRTLWVGNSFTSTNNIGDIVDNLLRLAGKQPSSVVLAKAAYTWSAWANDMEKPREKIYTDLGQQITKWNYVVLQEQSQIPGFYNPPVMCVGGDCPYQQSASTLEELATKAKASGATVVLWSTWGNLNGDAGNSIYKDFLSMNYRLTQGYLRYKRTLVTEAGFNDKEVLIAPSSRAYELIFNDPTAVVTHAQLYNPGDDKHPSLLASQLSAYIIAGTLLRKPLTGSTFYLSQDAKDVAVWDYLQSVAAKVLDTGSGCTAPGNPAIPSGLTPDSPPACAADTQCGGACKGYCTKGPDGMCAKCKASGESCSRPAECCDGIGCNSGVCGDAGTASGGGSTCRAAGKLCSADRQCCDKKCTAGQCAAPSSTCQPLDGDCNVDSDCCQGTACLNLVCVTAPDATPPPATGAIVCKVLGDYCQAGETCCTGASCVQGLCASTTSTPATSCVTAGGVCVVDLDCCAPGVCANGVCDFGGPPVCSSVGSACSASLVCCPPGICTNGVCASSATGCSTLGQACGAAAACCVGSTCGDGGVCVAGDPSGTGDTCTQDGAVCTSGQAGATCCGDSVCVSGVCGPCLTIGKTCGSGDECCSGMGCSNGLCMPAAAPPSGPCSPQGGSCTAEKDCCDGTTCEVAVCISLTAAATLPPLPPTTSTCNATGLSCITDADCCNGAVCANSTCGTGVGGGSAACRAATQPCGSTTDCCDGAFCVGGRCAWLDGGDIQFAQQVGVNGSVVWEISAGLPWAEEVAENYTFVLESAWGLCVHPETVDDMWPEDGQLANGTGLLNMEGCEEDWYAFVMRSSGSLQHVASGLCVNPEDGSGAPSNGSNLVLWRRCDEPGTEFEFTQLGSLRQVMSGMCVSPSGGEPEVGSALVLTTDCDAPYSTFNLTSLELFSGGDDGGDTGDDGGGSGGGSGETAGESNGADPVQAYSLREAVTQVFWEGD